MDTTVVVVIVVLLVVALAVAGLLLARRQRGRRLREHDGPEYEREVAAAGDPHRGEERLLERDERHQVLDVRELRPERERCGESRSRIQRGCVDDPVHAVQHADGLVVDLLPTRGHPVEDAARRTEEVSVAHPDIVQRYRDARAVKEATEHGPVDTEQQRHAVTSDRALVDALLGDPAHREEHTR